MSNQYYQQGDVLLKVINSLPDTGTRAAPNCVLQEGETTGHKHQFLETEKVRVFWADGTELLSGGDTIMPGIRKYVQVLEPTALTHEEHKPIIIAPGVYEMDLVREYDYDKHEMRRVVD